MEQQLRNACWNGKLKEVRALIRKGVNIDATDSNGYTGLILSARDGKDECVRLLIAAGANVNVQANDGWSALLGAAHYGRTKCVQQLIAAGADVDVQSGYGYTAVLGAAKNGHLENVHQLVAAGADLNVQDKEGMTALMEAAKFGRIECVKLLIGTSADMKIKEREGKTAETFANENGHTEVARILAEAREDPAMMERSQFREINEISVCKKEIREKDTEIIQLKQHLDQSLAKIAALDIESQINNSKTITSCRELEYLLQDLQMKLQRKKDAIYEAEKASKLCCICLEKEKEIMILPCLHVVFCESCSGSYRDRLCPICRTKIQNRVKPHF